MAKLVFGFSTEWYLGYGLKQIQDIVEFIPYLKANSGYCWVYLPFIGPIYPKIGQLFYFSERLLFLARFSRL